MYNALTLNNKERKMAKRKWEQTDAVTNRYFIGASTSGRTDDIYLSNGKDTIMLEDCLIWDDSEFTDEEADDILAHLQANNGVGVEEFDGWYLAA